MNKIKETISFYKKGIALASTREGGHITGDYSIESDTVNENGTRTIMLKPRDKAEFLATLKKLAKAIAERLGEGESKLMVGLLEDTLIDYREEDVERMYKKVMGGEQPVKAKEGCFRIIIGDGRKGDCDILSLRD